MHRHNESDRLRTPYDEAGPLDLSPSDETVNFLHTVFSLHG
ncbi:MAG: hypothetical protein WAW30_07540 [Patescibacteria group bacterium]